MKARFAVAAALSVLLCASASGGVTEVNLKLPLRPRLGLAEGQKLAVAPFVIATEVETSRGDRASKVDVQAEFARYLKKQLSKGTKLEVIDSNTTRLPGADKQALIGDRDFWRDLAAQTGADYVVTGIIDFDIEDKSGYKTEEYVSPLDGRTYYRQVLIETTGFVFDIVVLVFNGDTGEKIAEENFRDFKEFDERNYDEILGLFENLRSLEKQLLNIFVSQETSTTRFLFN